jgi:replicative DNA helicase
LSPPLAKNLDAERSVLSALLQGRDPQLIFSELSSADFSHQFHRRVFARMRCMAEAGSPLSLITLQETMKLDSMGTAELANLLNPLFLVRGFDADNVRIIQTHARHRELLHACDEMVESQNGDGPAQALQVQVKAAQYP